MQSGSPQANNQMRVGLSHLSFPTPGRSPVVVLYPILYTLGADLIKYEWLGGSSLVKKDIGKDGKIHFGYLNWIGTTKVSLQRPIKPS